MKHILSKNILLTPDDSKTNVIIPFELETDLSCLHFNTQYSPKNLEDEFKSKELIENALDAFMGDIPMRKTVDYKSYLPVTNLITFSLDGVNKHLGCVHRGAPHQDFFVSVNDASPGLETYSPVKGSYRVVLNVHCVATDSCEYKLEIYGE